MIFEMVLCTTAIVLHILCIKTIRYEEEKHTNNREITIQLSVIEVIACFVHMIVTALKNKIKIKELVVATEYFTVAILYYLYSITLIVDRFLAVYWNIKYPTYINRRHFLKTAILFWILTIVFIIWFANTSSEIRTEVTIIAKNTLFPLIETIYFILTVSVYAFIFWKLNKSSLIPNYLKRLSRRASRQHLIKRIIRTMLVFIIAITTFSPFFSYIVCNRTLNEMTVKLFVIVFVKAAVLHMLLQEHLRQKVKEFFRKKDRIDIDLQNNLFFIKLEKRPENCTAKYIRDKNSVLNNNVQAAIS